jgi:hypothetical protein
MNKDKIRTKFIFLSLSIVLSLLNSSVIFVANKNELLSISTTKLA